MEFEAKMLLISHWLTPRCQIGKIKVMIHIGSAWS